MTILVTGANGYIASHFILAFQKTFPQHNVIGVDMQPQTLKWTTIPIYRTNILYWWKLFWICHVHKITAIYHFAALTSVSESVKHPHKYFYYNTWATKKLLWMASLFKIKSIVFASSAAVYGNPTTTKPLKETDSCQPINPYGKSKLQAEKAIQTWAEKVPTRNYCIFRYFNVSGVGHDAPALPSIIHRHHLMPLMLQTAISKKTFVIYGHNYLTPDQTSNRDYVHINDLIAAHFVVANWILEKQLSFRITINLGTNTSTSTLTLVEKLQRQPHFSNFKFEFVPARSGEPASLIANIDLAKKILAWHPTHKIDDIFLSELHFYTKLN